MFWLKNNFYWSVKKMFNTNAIEKISTIENLKEFSFEITTGLRIHWPVFNYGEPITLTPGSFEEKTFAVKDNVLAFFVAGKLYVIPAFDEAFDILLSESFKQADYMYVPFANGEVPMCDGGKWANLQLLVAKHNRKKVA